MIFRNEDFGRRRLRPQIISWSHQGDNFSPNIPAQLVFTIIDARKGSAALGAAVAVTAETAAAKAISISEKAVHRVLSNDD